ncbi:TPA: hypothetical protein ACH3X1_006701 [Trebouxia sp. C0004]
MCQYFRTIDIVLVLVFTLHSPPQHMSAKYQNIWLLELVSKLLCCAYASYFTENQGLLTEQALLSKGSLFRQQAFGPSCAFALVLCLLLPGYYKSKLVSFTEPRVSLAIVVYVFRVPHCQVGALLSAMFHCHRPVAFTDATHALQALFAPVKPYTERRAG